ncbi:putative imelysin peptidase [Gordonia polyisoprenivorans VH2]|uniref:Putative imelysin peptidase n=1 Tax=Gordonia polyisoprenivorans (strain DSM 44266 / VH2) TaxID=1112204 RepID=H6MRK8_GORPV|nr:putative imelysin peptidase [Gordonia polyisoprenivorans VH2]OZC29397.1 peptidase M75 family protein [Gordonia polyisoprenivorans]HCS58931.1 peptidase M75 family protein [Gordonia polyisoprenivorans]
MSATAVAIVGVAACSSSDDGDSSSATKTVTVEMTNDGCKVTPDKVDAGPITFEIKNTNAAAVSEVELLQDGKILAERENIAPGMAATSFSHKLDGGTYELYCPGATNEKTTFTVTGTATKATGSVADQLNAAAAEYKQYVITQVNSLTTATQTLVDAVNAGDVAAAKDAYIKARPYYERIEPIAGSFCANGASDCSTDNAVNLDVAIDARPDALGPGDTWQGFHVIEKQLWEAGNLDGMKPVAATLLTNVKDLQRLVNEPSFTVKPADIINGAGDLLDEVSTSKLTGEEEAYSHIDFVDMQANIEGSQQAFAIVKPALNEIDPQLTTTIQQAFDRVDSLIDSFRDPNGPGGFKPFNDVTEQQKRDMAAAIIAVKDPLSQAGGKIAAAS